MSIANVITFFRLLLSPCFMLIYLFHNFLGISSSLLPPVLLIVLSISEFSDVIDGYIARKYNQISDFGKIFDPMTDSVSRITIFLTFTQAPVNLPLPFIFIFLARESIITTLRTICALGGLALAARTSGKLKAIVQVIACIAIVLLMMLESVGSISLAALQFYSFWITAVAAAYTIVSGLDYLYTHRQFILKTLRSEKKEQRWIEKPLKSQK